MGNKYCIDCVNYPVCDGACADDEICEDFVEDTDPEEPGNQNNKKS